MSEKTHNEPLVLCGAKSKRTECPCKQPAMKNGRCRLHGGKSTGPRTPEGLEKSRKANWKHGFYSIKAREEKRIVGFVFRKSRYLLDELMTNFFK